MAIVLPAVGTWPGVHPVGVLEPGLDHTEAHVKGLVETEHYLAAYYGAQHFSQAWPERLATGYSLIHFIGLGPSVILEQIIVPRHHCSGLRFTYRADGGEAGGQLRFRTIESAPVMDVALAPGIQEGYVDLLAVALEDTVSTVRIYATRDVGSTYLDVWALGCYDLNLTQAELAAL
jgi:hypothetical protein